MRLAPLARIAALLALTLAPCALHAATQSNLTPDTLHRTLHFLYIAAAVMGVVLIVVAAIAYAVYRKTAEEKLTPNPTDDSVR